MVATTLAAGLTMVPLLIAAGEAVRPTNNWRPVGEECSP
jgi:hypothetical protein